MGQQILRRAYCHNSNHESKTINKVNSRIIRRNQPKELKIKPQRNSKPPEKINNLNNKPFPPSKTSQISIFLNQRTCQQNSAVDPNKVDLYHLIRIRSL
jgi:hypothetical protein